MADRDGDIQESFTKNKQNVEESADVKHTVY